MYIWKKANMKKLILLLTFIIFYNCQEDKTNTEYLVFKEKIQHYYSMNSGEYIVVTHVKKVDTINAEPYYSNLYNEYKSAVDFYKEYPNKSKDFKKKAKYSRDVLMSNSTANKLLILAEKHTRIYDSVKENMIKYKTLLEKSDPQKIIKVFIKKENEYNVSNFEDVYLNKNLEVLGIKVLGVK
jgi:hypothetical protein